MFLFDTYALIEIIKGNKKYDDYLDKEIIINSFILTELAYYLIREHGFDIASSYVERYKKYVKSIDSEIIKLAMLFRYNHRKQKLSMADCVSYFMAKSLGIKFLTGDKEFKNFEDVEFVK